MKVNFEKIYTNKLLKKGLKCAADNGGLFVAGTSLALAGTLRPLAISLTPKTDKENRKLAAAKSIASAGIDCAIMTAITVPVTKSLKKIDNMPNKYLSEKTISNLTENGKTLVNSNGYKFSTQLFKLGTRIITAAPKAIITCALIPPIMNLLNKGRQVKQIDAENNKINNKGAAISFTGRTNPEILTKGIGKVIDNKYCQDFSNRFKNSNFGMHMMAIADSVATLTFAHQTKNNKNIKNERKNTLINNALISTGLSIISGYAIDKSLEKPTDKFIKKFSEANKGAKDLNKYIDGIKIAKPALILGGIYYGIIPVISTFLAELTTINTKTDKTN